MTNSDKASLRDMMSDVITERHESPNDWNTAARRVAEKLGLKVAQIAFSQVLVITCDNIIDEAANRGRSAEDVLAALRP